jgi:hyperosmotically inducible protein
MLSKNHGIFAAAIAVTLLSACSAMILGESSTESPALGGDIRGPAQIAADDALTEAVASALDSGSDLLVSARSGAVTLSGTLASFEKRDQAVALATSVSGVSSVNNQIRVKTTD